MEETQALQAEVETYRRLKDQLVAESQGKFAVICGDELAGVWDTYEDALQAGYTQFGLNPFLVKQIQSVERVQHFSRDITPCPS